MITSIATAAHYKWGADCDGWHLLQSDQLSVIQELMPGGTDEALHYHSKAQQVFYILEGIATFKLQNDTYTLIKGESITVAPGAIHQLLNLSDSPLSFLVISAPKAHGDRINIEE
ncbi:mannose-6-phosphate isomerase-like protein (cupin superfamily) [Pedobacter cryoconitis]|uniref:Mannose-6-phosphate isomerase-like protein (Cupin superfamily) n=1 Tax=Pedobacter cryoconitis TaxID=188932 RepID=A0A7W8ZR98_9SPHI|nr:cupin domain-containing protein [Pedobacter cryoconitis]MBB5638759.1 mannose-6-phosphate isomerase-like protein (cupin superfamily) [Pedobacter cryoconitis]MBB6270231.1 mannose-6-phosphate isomerase-like protein (cupin superfamily) [Pedobacter cryoconitis]